MDVFDFNNNDSVDIKLTKAIDYLSTLKPREIIDHEKSYHVLNFLSQYSNNVNPEIFLDKNVDELLSNILLELYTIRTLLTYDGLLDVQKEDAKGRKISIMVFCLFIINIICLKSVKFTRKISANLGLEAHLKFLNDHEFINKNIKLFITDNFGCKTNIIYQLVLNVYVFSKNTEDHMSKWIELDSANILLKAAKLEPSIQLDSYLAIANIVDDKQIENLTEIHGIVEHIQSKINLIANDFKQKKFNRNLRQIIDDDQIVNVQVHCILDGNGLTYSLLVFLSGLYQLSVNDKLRYDIYFNNNFNNNLKIILFDSNEIEMKFALKLYAQLSFNSRVVSDLRLNEDLIQFFKSKLNDKSIKALCEQILWNIEQVNLAEEINMIKKSGEHIMISYNSASRDLCMKIKSCLEKLGYKVWIDVENIHGSSLDSMAKAIEKSICVLICITEKYRQSINCQSEALYAFRLKKNIIPLIMQKNYENVQGWLGLIVGDKIFVNFTKYSFDECINRLYGEVKNLPIDTKIIQVKVDEPIEKWNEHKVKEWFETNALNNEIFKIFNPCNGIILHQLYEMRRDAPEFYFQSFKGHDIDMNSMLNFTHCLKKLFSH